MNPDTGLVWSSLNILKTSIEVQNPASPTSLQLLASGTEKQPHYYDIAMGHGHAAYGIILLGCNMGKKIQHHLGPLKGS